MRTIRVTGKGQLKVHPDMTRITVTLSGDGWEYGETLEKSSKDTEKMKDLMVPFGFQRTDLKTLRFDVETVYGFLDEEFMMGQNIWMNGDMGEKRELDSWDVAPQDIDSAE